MKLNENEIYYNVPKYAVHFIILVLVRSTDKNIPILSLIVVSTF